MIKFIDQPGAPVSADPEPAVILEIAMARLSPWKDRSGSMPDIGRPSSRTWQRFCAPLTMLLCAGPAFAPFSAQAAPAFFDGPHGIMGPSSSPGHARMYDPGGDLARA
jgi:hypothetical protein